MQGILSRDTQLAHICLVFFKNSNLNWKKCVCGGASIVHVI